MIMGLSCRLVGVEKECGEGEVEYNGEFIEEGKMGGGKRGGEIMAKGWDSCASYIGGDMQQCRYGFEFDRGGYR